MPQTVASGADDANKKKMSQAKAANTREVTAGKREATPPSKPATEKRYKPNGIPVQPYPIGALHRTDARSETSQPGSALGKGYSITDGLPRAKEKEAPLPKPMGQRAAGYKRPDLQSPVKASGSYDKTAKPYHRERYGEREVNGRTQTAGGLAVQKAGINAARKAQAAEKAAAAAGRPLTEPFRQVLKQDIQAGRFTRQRGDEISGRQANARQLAQSQEMRDMMARRRANAAAAAQQARINAEKNSPQARAKAVVSQAVNRGKNAANTVARQGKAAAKSPVARFGAGFALGVGAMAARRARDVGDAEYNGFQKGKVAGRQTTSTGASTNVPRGKATTPAVNRPLGKASTGPRTEVKRSNGSYVSPMRKKLMGR